MGFLFRCFLLGPLWAAAVAFAEEGDLKEKARLYWKAREAGQLSSQQKQYDELIQSVAKHLKLDDARQRKLLSAAKPLYEAGLEHWRKIYELHVIANGDDESNPDFGNLLADSVHHPSSQKSRESLRELWANWLESNLTPEEHAVWQSEAARRRERAIKSMSKGVDQRIKNATESVMSELEGEIDQKVSDAEMDESRAKRMTDALAKAEQIYRSHYRRQLESVLEDWKKGDFLTDLGKVVALEKQETMTIYVPGTKEAYMEARKVLDETWKALVTPHEEKKIVQKQAAVATRVDTIVKLMSERVEEQTAQPSLKKQQASLDGLIQATGKDEELAAKLKARIEVIHKEALADWRQKSQTYIRKGIERQIARGNREDRIKQIEAGNFWFSSDEANRALSAQLRKEWGAMLNQELTEEQRKRWLEQEELRKGAREKTWLLLLVSEVDQKARLSASQREKMEQVLLPLCKDLAVLDDLRGVLGYQSLSYLLVMLEGVEKQGWKDCLEPWQVKSIESVMAKRGGYWSSIQARIKAAKENQLP